MSIAPIIRTGCGTPHSDVSWEIMRILQPSNPERPTLPFNAMRSRELVQCRLEQNGIPPYSGVGFPNGAAVRLQDIHSTYVSYTVLQRSVVCEVSARPA